MCASQTPLTNVSDSICQLLSIRKGDVDLSQLPLWEDILCFMFSVRINKIAYGTDVWSSKLKSLVQGNMDG